MPDPGETGRSGDNRDSEPPAADDPAADDPAAEPPATGQAAGTASGNAGNDDPEAEAETTRPRSTRDLLYGPAGWIAAGAAVLALLVGIGVAQPRPDDPIRTDRLGPVPGQQVEDYLAAARASLPGDEDRNDEDLHWALVSFTERLTAEQIPGHRGGMRISGVLEHVAIPRVQTPVVLIATPAGPEVAARADVDAAGIMLGSEPAGQRAADVARVTSERLRKGCACTVGLLVRGTGSQLRALAGKPGIRAVEALPADAVYGRFAVVPLRPETTGSIAPVPDDGPVPAE